MWLSTSLTWMTMPPCLTGRNTGDQRNMMTSRVDNIENLNVRVSIVEDIQPGTKFAKVNFFACFFFVSCLFKQSRVSHPLGYRELQSWSTKLIAIFHNFQAVLKPRVNIQCFEPIGIGLKFLKLSWYADWLIYWRKPWNFTKRHAEFCWPWLYKSWEWLGQMGAVNFVISGNLSNKLQPSRLDDQTDSFNFVSRNFDKPVGNIINIPCS